MLLHAEQTDRLSTCRRETCICCYHVSDLSRSPEILQDPSTATPVAPTYSIYRLRKQSRGPTCQWPRTRTEWGPEDSDRWAPRCCPCIFWHVASQLPKMPGFFLCGETHHSPFVMDQPCPYLVFSVWVASCKACRLQTLNQLQTPVVFSYWMEILSLQ